MADPHEEPSGMDIGEQRRIIQVEPEPIEVPSVPEPVPQPAPDPVTAPARR